MGSTTRREWLERDWRLVTAVSPAMANRPTPLDRCAEPKSLRRSAAPRTGTLARTSIEAALRATVAAVLPAPSKGDGALPHARESQISAGREPNAAVRFPMRLVDAGGEGRRSADDARPATERSALRSQASAWCGPNNMAAAARPQNQRLSCRSYATTRPHCLAVLCQRL